MAIFARKKEVISKEIPDLPELPELPDLNKAKMPAQSYTSQIEDNFQVTEEIKDLPSFPDSKFGDSLSQEAVKSAIEPPKKLKKLTMEIPSSDFNFDKPAAQQKDFYTSIQEEPIQRPIHPVKIQPIKPAPLPKLSFSVPKTKYQEQEIEYEEEMPEVQYSQQPKKAVDSIYVRIDKFKFAIDSFQGIKEKINEVGKYLQEIKEQKRKEDEELGAWESEIEAIKLRIDAIDNKIFSKI